MPRRRLPIGERPRRRLGLVRLVFVTIAGLALAPIFVAVLEPAETDDPTLHPSLVLTPGRQFASGSYIHTRLHPDAALDSRSEAWVSDLQRQVRAYGASVNIDRFSPPLYVVGRDQPTIRVRAASVEGKPPPAPELGQIWNAVPLPLGFAPAEGTDRDAVIYQPDTGRYWEFWLLSRTGTHVENSAGRRVPQWQAYWGGFIETLGESPGFFVQTASGTKFGTAATGLALLGGLMTMAELRRGAVEHAIHFAIPETRERTRWVLPAQRSDGQTASDLAIPEGATFRLPADLDLDALDMDPFARVLARAVQRYGMVLRDRAGSVAFYAENPGKAFKTHPYFGENGILACPEGHYEQLCAPDMNNRLRGFPWARLQALRAIDVAEKARSAGCLWCEHWHRPQSSAHQASSSLVGRRPSLGNREEGSEHEPEIPVRGQVVEEIVGIRHRQIGRHEADENPRS
jgi:hypothetical protein